MNPLIGQLMFMGISGHALTADEKKFIVENNIGGVVLFGRNVAEPKQVRDLCAEIQSLRHQQADRAPLFIGIDMEGGRVHRLKPPFTVWPAVAKLGQIDNPTVTFHFAQKMGQELLAAGINLDFAPSVDILTNPQNKVIGDRSIGSDLELVEKHASALVRGYVKSGIISCAKHFPGHGNTFLDSHEDLPIEDLDLRRLNEIEIPPFKKAFRARVDMVLTAHIRFPKIDPVWPATLSEIFLKDILRKELRYRGLIITDDLGMKALTKHYSVEEVAVRAIEAGADLLLYCNEPDAPPRALDAVTEAVAQGRLKKAEIESIRDRVFELKKEKLRQPDPPPLDLAMKIIGHPDHLRLAAAIAKGESPAGLQPE
ncbi:MAG: beta-N-acetylhexosaminidase [Bdellovibrionaceae bacterium]|nr:beta-N-acetylhexosaminidase [Pseudobdellovibrionaceae bacterium]MBX3033757.1 beta-N-acetylhexosaminidase [Pseudobdellovibrionaceae bacterium]